MAAERRPPRGRNERREGSDLIARILVAVPLIVLTLVLIHLGGLAWALFMIAIGWACVIELYGLLARWRPVSLVGLAAVAGLVLAAHYGNARVMFEVTVITVPVLFLAATALGQGHLTTALASTLLGVYWIGFAVAHGVLLRQLPHGNAIVIDVLVGTFLGDTGAYLGGRLFGKRPLAPSISPNKTVEGLAIGMLCTVISVWFAGRYQDWMPGAHALVLGLGVAILAPIGDLFESFVKRQAGAKDTGSLLGAHGGVLDRLDAILFTAVAGYYIWLAYV